MHARLALNIAAVVGGVAGIASLVLLVGGGGGAVAGVWLNGLFWVAMGAAGLFCLSRRLPMQNVVAVALVTLCTPAVLMPAIWRVSLGQKLVYADFFGPRLGEVLPWQEPFFWLAAVVISRETARTMLRPWRRVRYYGYWLIGVATLLSLGCDMGWESFGGRGFRWWEWTVPVGAIGWYGAPWAVMLVDLLMAAALLVLSAPWMVMKRPIAQVPDGWAPALWSGLVAYLAVGNAGRGVWGAAALMAVLWVVVMGMAWQARLMAGGATAPSPASSNANG